MRAHVIEDGVVVNTILVNSLSDRSNLVEATGSSGVGWKWDGTTFTNPNAISTSENNALNAKYVRRERDHYLTESDWTQNRDVTLSNDTNWKTYRQALRDVPTQSGFPNSVSWPTKPS